MSLLRNLTGITTPASTDLFYVVQNNTDYKMTSEQFLNFAKSAIVVSLTQAQYDALTPAEKSNGSIYLINDATLSASDIAYGQGTVEDSLDELTDTIASFTPSRITPTISNIRTNISVDASYRDLLDCGGFYYIAIKITASATIPTWQTLFNIAELVKPTAYAIRFLAVNQNTADKFIAYADNGKISNQTQITAGDYWLISVIPKV